MTEFGKALWMVMQDKGPYSRSSFARLLGQRTGWKPSRQAVSNWLKGDRDVPRELIPAAVVALELDEETQRELEHLYFYGQDRENSKFTIQPQQFKRPHAPEETGANIEAIEKLEDRWDDEDAELQAELDKQNRDNQE